MEQRAHTHVRQEVRSFRVGPERSLISAEVKCFRAHPLVEYNENKFTDTEDPNSVRRS